MWTELASGVLALASASADDSANIIQDEVPQAAAGASADNTPFPGFDGKMPTPQQLLDVLDSMTGISDEDKQTLREDLLKNIQEQAAQAQALAGSGFTQTVVLLSLLAVVALIFVFFAYKLLKCTSERAKKGKEKKKNKHNKKK